MAPASKFLCLLVDVSPECSTHSDCQSSQICHKGSCQEACRFKKCGYNAQCYADNHLAQCKCIKNTFGNPTTACQYSKTSKCFIY